MSEESQELLRTEIARLERGIRSGFRRMLGLWLLGMAVCVALGALAGNWPPLSQRIAPLLVQWGIVASAPQAEAPYFDPAPDPAASEAVADLGLERMRLEAEIAEARERLAQMGEQLRERRDELGALARRDPYLVRIDGNDYRILGTGREGDPHVFAFSQVSDFLGRNPQALVVIVSEVLDD
jgi:hypothetical protein